MTTNSPSTNENILTQARGSLESMDIRHGMEILRSVAGRHGMTKILTAIDNLESRYFYMLRFMMSNPESATDKEMSDLQKDAMQLVDDIRHELAAEGNDMYGAALRYARLRPEENLHSMVSDYLSEAERLRTDINILTDPKARRNLERMSSDIFNNLWTIYHPDDDTVKLLNDLLSDNSIPSADRELWVNALGLSLTFWVNDSVVDILLKVAASDNRRLAVASAVWLTIVAVCFAPDKDIIDRLSKMSTFNITDIINASISNLSDGDYDFFSSLADMSRKFSNIDISNPESIKNIDFSSEDYDRLKRFSQAQQGGFDVFGRTLGRMRHFPFFSRISNWFLPFDARHSELADVTDGEGAEIAESIAMMPTLADSDKYAMLLSMGQMPESMRSQTQTKLVDSIRSMSDTPEYADMMEQLSKVPDNAMIANQVHTLLRFVKSFPKASEFALTSRWSADRLLNVGQLRAILDDKDMLRLAMSAAGQKMYDKAILLFDSVLDNSVGSMTDAELETAADVFILDKNSLLSQTRAADLYSELLSRRPEEVGIMVKLANAYGKFGDDQALISLLENLGDRHTTDTLRLLGAAYARSGKTDEAIDAFHQADYLLPGDSTYFKIRLAYLYLFSDKATEAGAMIEVVEKSLRDNPYTGLESVILWIEGRYDDAVDNVASHLVGSDDDVAKYIQGLKNTVARLAKGPVCGNTNYRTLTALPDMALYRARGSQFGNL